jgi:hypothetical protein
MDKVILICATGRSGSTTMQRIINTIPNSNICGENYGALNSLLEFYYRIKYTTANYVPGHLKPASYEDIVSKNVKPAWYNSYDFQKTVTMIKILITSLFKKSDTTNVWGFKEIRYDNGDIKYVKLFKELFPQTKVIIQIRENINAQSQSSWMKDDKNSLKYLNNLNNVFYKFYQENADFCYFITFEKMFDTQQLKTLFKFIECDEFYNAHKIQEVLSNNIKD